MATVPDEMFEALIAVNEAPEPLNVVAVKVLGKLVFPLPSNIVAVRVNDENTPVYCLT